MAGMAMTISALEREESRGSHYREDFPNEEEKWLSHIHVGMLDGSPVIKHVAPIKEIVSFRGRFCEQARNGETVIAQGKIEKVSVKRDKDEYYRLLLGGKPSDTMVLV